MTTPTLPRAFLGMIVRPRATIPPLVCRRRLDLAAGVVLSYGVLYTITAAVLALQGRRPVVRPVLPIPEERYYAAQAMFTIPVAAASWLVMSGAARSALAATGHRTYLRVCATVLGFSAHVPWIVGMWLPETAVAFFFPQYWGAPEGSSPVVDWIGSYYLWAVSAWAIGLSTGALHDGARAGWRRSLLAAVFGVGASTGFQMIPIR